MLAPAIATSFGVPASLIGVFVGLVYVGAMVASLLSGAYIARHGAIRVSQACVAACAIGIAGVAAAGPSMLPLVVIAQPEEQGVVRSFRNLERVLVLEPSELEVGAIVWARSVLATEGALERVSEAMSK